jgi:hypothetical protein
MQTAFSTARVRPPRATLLPLVHAPGLPFLPAPPGSMSMHRSLGEDAARAVHAAEAPEAWRGVHVCHGDCACK